MGAKYKVCLTLILLSFRGLSAVKNCHDELTGINCWSLDFWLDVGPPANSNGEVCAIVHSHRYCQKSCPGDPPVVWLPIFAARSVPLRCFLALLPCSNLFKLSRQSVLCLPPRHTRVVILLTIYRYLVSCFSNGKRLGFSNPGGSL